MICRLSSGVSTSSEKTGICCGPVSMASYMCFAETPMSVGAKRPRGRAPPAPAKLWQAVQLVRKNSPPRTMSSLVTSETSYSDSSGTSGPGPSEATYAASASISSWS